LVMFVQPPARPYQAGHRGNWLPTLMVLGLFACLIGVLTIAPLRALFNLQALNALDYLIIGGATVLWGVLLQTLWHFHLFERFLQIETNSRGACYACSTGIERKAGVEGPLDFCSPGKRACVTAFRSPQTRGRWRSLFPSTTRKKGPLL